MEKFPGQRQQLNYLCLYEQSILNINKAIFFAFSGLYIFRPECKSERISITIATNIQPCIYTTQRIIILILVSKNQQYHNWIIKQNTETVDTGLLLFFFNMFRYLNQLSNHSLCSLQISNHFQIMIYNLESIPQIDYMSCVLKIAPLTFFFFFPYHYCKGK